MRNKIFLILFSLVLTFVTTFVFLIGLSAGREGHEWRPYFVIFICLLLVHLVYYIWLIRKKYFSRIFILSYIPVSAILFITFAYLMIFPFWLRRISFNIGPDPFAPKTTITAHTKFAIWQKEFWFSSARENVRLKILKNMQTARQGSLIGHIGTDLQGWTEEEIKYAFGEPEKIITMATGLEKWIYYPWTNHPDWEMPVYVQDEKLLKIGD